MRDRYTERKKRRKRGLRVDAHGYDANKKIKGKKRHILVDTTGLPITAAVSDADMQDRDSGPLVPDAIGGLFPRLKKMFADGGYQGPRFRESVASVRKKLEVEIVKRSDKAKGFEVVPKRWVVERTLAWLGRCRRLAVDGFPLRSNTGGTCRLFCVWYASETCAHHRAFGTYRAIG